LKIKEKLEKKGCREIKIKRKDDGRADRRLVRDAFLHATRATTLTAGKFCRIHESQ
jgi:hypothetical protein